jgi:hypothetical protein
MLNRIENLIMIKKNSIILLLRKVEELTLYVIELNKEIQILKEKK